MGLYTEYATDATATFETPCAGSSGTIQMKIIYNINMYFYLLHRRSVFIPPA